jgi:hypothetical protein
MKTLKEPMSWLLFFVVTLNACLSEDSLPQNPESYFPMDNNREWNYQRRLSFNAENHLDILWDTLKIVVKGDVVVDGKTYKEMVDNKGMFNKLIRIEGSKYYGRNHELYGNDYSHEYIFLDTNKDVGESWSYLKDDGFSKTEYIVLAKNTTDNVLGLEYKKVIELQVNYYQLSADSQFEEYVLWVTAFHKYAEGVGEIYNFYPAPVSGIYGDLSSFFIAKSNGY